MDEQTTLPDDGLIGLPMIDFGSLRDCEESALFYALRRIITDSKPSVTIAGFESCLPPRVAVELDDHHASGSTES